MKKAIFIVCISVILSILIIVLSQVIASRSDGTGELQVTSQPDAKVYLNDQLLGQTPLCRCASVNPQSVLQAKEYTLKLVPISGDNVPFYEHISIVKGVLTVVDRTFGGPAQSEGSTLQLESLPSPSDAGMIVTSFPTQASVFIDGNQIGTTPYSYANPTDSDHILLLKKLGYKDKTLHIRTPKGYKLHVVMYLSIDPNVTLTPGGNTQDTVAASPSADSPPLLSPTQPTVVKVTILNTPTGFLRVRVDANAGSDVIEEVKPGDSLFYVSEVTGWYQVKLADNKIGWVSTQYAKKE